MKRIVILIFFAVPMLGAPTRGLMGPIEHELKDLLSEAEYLAHEAIVGTEDVLREIPSIISAYEDSLKARFAIERPGPHSAEQALVSTSLDEDHLLTARNERAQEAIKRMLPEITTPPCVGFCGSGGGIRAMYVTLGALCGLDDLGLLDTVLYASGLSGSTWALNPWVASQKPIQDYTHDLMPQLTISLADQVKDMTDEDLYALLIVLGRTYYNKRQLTLVDIYGALTAHCFLKNHVPNPLEFDSTALQPHISDGSFPYIISCSVAGANKTITGRFDHKPTYEFTPFHMGSFEAEAFVPTWAFGRVFEQGKSPQVIPHKLFPEADLILSAAQKIAPLTTEVIEDLYNLIKAFEDEPYYGHEVPLGYVMGICGSAFSTDLFNVLFQLYQMIRPGSVDPAIQRPLKAIIELVQDVLEETIGLLGQKLSNGKITAEELVTYLQNNQLAAATVPNLNYQMGETPFDQLATINLVDGGFDLMGLDRSNIGIAPLLYRDLDLIIISDATDDNQGGSALRAAQQVAALLNRPFPSIDYAAIEKRPATLIVDENNLDAPVIVYMPGIANPAYTTQTGKVVDPQADCFSTLVFKYPIEQAEGLTGLIRFSTIQSAEILFDAYHRAAERKAQKLL